MPCHRRALVVRCLALAIGLLVSGPAFASPDGESSCHISLEGRPLYDLRVEDVGQGSPEAGDAGSKFIELEKRATFGAPALTRQGNHNPLSLTRAIPDMHLDSASVLLASHKQVAAKGFGV